MRIFLAAIALSVITTPSMAQDRRDDGQTVKVLERDERGEGLHHRRGETDPCR